MLLTKPFTKIFLAALLCLIGFSSVNATGKIEIHDAWVREAPPGATVMAAYFTLRNRTPENYTLVGLSSSAFKKVAMHRTREDDGMSKMIAVEKLTIPANSSVSFQPGDMHVMLIQPQQPLKAGKQISLTLLFSDKSSLQVTLPVKRGQGSAMHDMPSHSHQH